MFEGWLMGILEHVCGRQRTKPLQNRHVSCLAEKWNCKVAGNLLRTVSSDISLSLSRSLIAFITSLIIPRFVESRESHRCNAAACAHTLLAQLHFIRV